MSDDVNLALGAVSGAIVGAIGTVMAVRRRWSKDTAENAQDTAQVNLLESLQAERDDARTQAEKLLAKHIADTKTIAELTADKQRSARDVRRLRRLVPAEDAQKFLGSDPDALDGLDFGYGRRRGDSAEMLAEAIARLPPPERQVCELGLIGKKSIAQIAAELQMPEERVEQLYHRGRHAMRRAMR